MPDRDLRHDASCVGPKSLETTHIPGAQSQTTAAQVGHHLSWYSTPLAIAPHPLPAASWVMSRWCHFHPTTDILSSSKPSSAQTYTTHKHTYKYTSKHTHTHIRIITTIIYFLNSDYAQPQITNFILYIYIHTLYTY